eukprot:CAMPEP_0113933914 /NCGR_PEP_ID=MMETSP1339-20121228/1262_1 /TAXON_ID=94617 /ORGANISM="Fibrocapsa japonica" /LENGTH=296 /DNA_ID=CAMNT_0000935475 /DNA_START=69 /DNA_END=959 /DNA_ORIENTATION=- /assembly_acc=CAM_ASM_000762
MAKMFAKVAVAAAVLACTTQTAAFTPVGVRTGSSSLLQPSFLLNAEPEKQSEKMDLDLEDMFEMFEDADKTVTNAETKTVQSQKAKGPRNAQWLPFGVKAPAMLDGTLAADVGFDPVGFSDSRAQLINMREAEVKHARLAMLAAIGWPAAEKIHGGLAAGLNLDNLLANDVFAPSVLNGGLGNLVVILGLGLAFNLAALIEVGTLGNSQKLWEDEKSDDYVPGTIGFDPLNLYTFWGKTDSAKMAMETAELKNGRTAMMAMVFFAFSEKLTGVPVIEQAPWAFQPFWETIAQLMSM